MKMEDMIARFEKRIESLKDKPGVRSRYFHACTQKTYFQKVLRAKEEGKPRAWTCLFVPTELFWAMDIVPFAVEQYVIQLLALGQGYEYFDIGEAYGFPKESCAPHLATLGSALSGDLPPPDLMIGSGQSPCDSAAVMYENLNYIHKTPIHYINIPYFHGEDAVKDYKEELKALVAFLENTTGNKLDLNRLREALEIYRITQDYFIKFHRLRKHIPSPITSRGAFASMGMGLTCSGIPETIDFYQAQYEEAKARAEQGQGAVPVERHRILFHGPPPFWHMQILDWIEKEYQAVIVADLLNHWPLYNITDISDPLEALACKALSCFGGSLMHTAPIKATVDWIVEAAKEYQVDGAILTANFGCKQGCSRTRPIADGLRKELGIPVMIFDMDAGNPSVVPVAQMELKLHQYFQTLETRGLALHKG